MVQLIKATLNSLVDINIIASTQVAIIIWVEDLLQTLSILTIPILEVLI